MKDTHIRRVALTGALFFLIMATDLQAQTASAANDKISAPIIARELRTLGHTAAIDADPSGDPRVNTEVDGRKWQIYFYDCDRQGLLEQRECESFQFFTDNNMLSTVSLQTINNWNRKTSYAKAYLQQKDDAGCAAKGACSARIEVDVETAGTSVDPAQTFRTYFAIFRQRSTEFRNYIGAK